MQLLIYPSHTLPFSEELQALIVFAKQVLAITNGALRCSQGLCCFRILYPCKADLRISCRNIIETACAKHVNIYSTTGV